MAQEPNLQPHQFLTAADLKEKIKNEDVFVIDVRNPSEIQGAYIKTKRSINIPLPDLENALNLSNDDFKAKYGVEKPSGTGSDLVFHCGRGTPAGRGSKAVAMATTFGFTGSQNLSGGYKNWAAEGYDK